MELEHSLFFAACFLFTFVLTVQLGHILFLAVAFLLTFVLGLVLFVLMLARRRRYHEMCRTLGLQPSPIDIYYCVGNWRDAHVVIERHFVYRGVGDLRIFIDIGELPLEALQQIAFRAANSRSAGIFRYEGDPKLSRIIYSAWLGGWGVWCLNAEKLDRRSSRSVVYAALENVYACRQE